MGAASRAANLPGKDFYHQDTNAPRKAKRQFLTGGNRANRGRKKIWKPAFLRYLCCLLFNSPFFWPFLNACVRITQLRAGAASRRLVRGRKTCSERLRSYPKFATALDGPTSGRRDVGTCRIASRTTAAAAREVCHALTWRPFAFLCVRQSFVEQKFTVRAAHSASESIRPQIESACTVSRTRSSQNLRSLRHCSIPVVRGGQQIAAHNLQHLVTQVRTHTVP